MASDTLQADTASHPATPTDTASTSVRPLILTVFSSFASLKLTVALFAMAIFLILAGTLAQVRSDIWDVISGYFRTPIAWIDFQLFFPPSFFPSRPQVPGGFYFPGGWSIGAVMIVNLLAAHGIRFKPQARGARLTAGVASIAIGLLLTWIVIVSGTDSGGVQDVASISWLALWRLVLVGLACLWLAGFYAFATLDRQRTMQRTILLVALGGLGAFLCWLLWQGDAVRLGDSSMRILWQLIKGGLAGLVLLAGCVLVFKKRAGIVLLHAGVGLMMVNELLVGLLAVEGQMMIQEGQAINYVQDIRAVELAVVETSDPEHDDVVVVPQSVFLASETVRHDELPFDIQRVRYLKNSTIRRLKPGEENPATVGAGQLSIVDDVPASTGTDSDSAVDQASAYIELKRKPDGKSFGTYLVSQYLRPQPVEIGEQTYEIQLRFKRTYKPYSMALEDVRQDLYLGTATPSNYSSDLHLLDPTRDVDRKVHIWMNNPLRFAGETFYQSQYHADLNTGIEATTLSVVTNTGWMIPYVACMIVATGLLAHFSITLLRFLNRTVAARAAAAGASGHEHDSADEPSGVKSKTVRRSKRRGPGRAETRKSMAYYAATALPTAVVLIFAVWLMREARPPNTPIEQMQLYEFGKLPIVYQGRVKPIDTLARNSLRIISDKETFTLVDAPSKRSFGIGPERQAKEPAIRWLLDVISGHKDMGKHPVIRIDNLEVLETLGLPRRKRFRYAVEEFSGRMGEFEKQARLAYETRERNAEELTFYQRKILETDKRIRTFMLLMSSFHPPDLPPLPTMEQFEKDHDTASGQLSQFRDALIAQQQSLARFQPPLVVPFETEGKTVWEPYATAWTKAFVQARLLGQDPDPATAALTEILAAYREGDAEAFNRGVAKYQGLLERHPPDKVQASKVGFESFFNHFAPFYHAAAMYVVAFVLAALAWLGLSGPLNRASLWLNGLTLAVHTFALIARIYISGRPPVTNLYSSAVFIGWGCVVLALILEVIFRMGIGNVIAGAAGFATLLIAHFLAGDGDTFTVLQAVLDTQFWLATHVVCITMGYATTFLAGGLGIIYILRGVLTPSLKPAVAKDLGRMIYGILCFAIFFSFVGTVLGGLWADDSWGRFWGWDPKENGALMIVLFNALVLHARWGGMVKDRGMAVLALGGNITTSWSWFAVNELGIGLHSYGFTEGVLKTLALFVASQLAIMSLGLLPKRYWMSFRRAAASAV